MGHFTYTLSDLTPNPNGKGGIAKFSKFDTLNCDFLKFRR